MIGDLVSFALDLGRPAALERMRGRCVIRRPGPLVTDESGDVTQTLEQVYPAPAWPSSHPHAHGPCRTHYTGVPWPSPAESAGATIVLRPTFVSIPFGVQLEVGDEVEILSDPDTPQLVGMRGRVVEPANASQETAQRILVNQWLAGVKP